MLYIKNGHHVISSIQFCLEHGETFLFLIRLKCYNLATGFARHHPLTLPVVLSIVLQVLHHNHLIWLTVQISIHRYLLAYRLYLLYAWISSHIFSNTLGPRYTQVVLRILSTKVFCHHKCLIQEYLSLSYFLWMIAYYFVDVAISL